MLESFITGLINKTSGSVLMLTFSGITLATSGVAGAKLYNIVKNPEIPETSEVSTAGAIDQAGEVEKIIEELEPKNESDIPTEKLVDIKNENVADDSMPVIFPTAVPRSIVNDSPTPPISENNNSCVIRLFGKNYDIASFRKIHAGGDVFICGTDMSTKYQSAHGQNVSGLTAYATSAPLGSPTSTTSVALNSTSNTTSFKDQEAHEEEEYHEEKERHYEKEESHEEAEHEDD